MCRVVTMGVVALLGFAIASPASDAATPFRPASPDFVVAELPGGASRARDGFALQLQRSRSDPEAAAKLAGALLEQARLSGQPQLYGRAESALAPWIARPDAPAGLLVMQANILQQRHEFQPATALLDRAIARDSRAAHAHLMRANVYIVTGDFEHARTDCAWLLGSGEQWTGTVCLGQVLGSTGQLDRARALLERLMTKSAASPSPDVLAWTLAVSGDLAVRAGALSEAEKLLTRALSLAPYSDFMRLALTDVLMMNGRTDDALKVLDTARPSVGVLLRRVEVLGDTRDVRRDAALTELRERLAVSSRRGERTHLREETRLALEFSPDPSIALVLARDNFMIQRETEDVRLLARAASAARDRAALTQLQQWLQHTRYQDAAVERLLHPGKSS